MHEIDQYIIEHYQKQLIKDMAAHFGIKWQLIQQRCNKLIKKGLLDPRKKCYQPKWTQAEIEYLTERFGLVSDATICRRLKRSPVAMRLKAKRLGLVKKMNMFSLTDVGKIFGVDAHEVRRWIYEGRLQGRQAPWKQGPYQVWIITVDAIEDFVKNNPCEYDLRRINEDQWPWVYRLAKKYGFPDLRMRQTHYSQEEVQYIIDNYARMGPDAVAAKLGRPAKSVAHKAKKLRGMGHPIGNRKSYIKHPNAWSEFEDWFLVTNFHTLKKTEIASVLGRTAGACGARFCNLRKANKLGQVQHYYGGQQAA